MLPGLGSRGAESAARLRPGGGGVGGVGGSRCGPGPGRAGEGATIEAGEHPGTAARAVQLAETIAGPALPFLGAAITEGGSTFAIEGAFEGEASAETITQASGAQLSGNAVELAIEVV